MIIIVLSAATKRSCKRVTYHLSSDSLVPRERQVPCCFISINKD
jgi:hypothetical protein